MLSWLGRFLSSSIGKKTLMALTGLCLVAFLVVHLAGNLTLIFGGEESFNHYADKLESYGLLLNIAEVGLLALFAVHIGMGLRVSRENSAARSKGYQMRAGMGKKTAGSSTMLISGLVIGVFLVIHIIDFRVPKLAGSIDDLAQAVVARIGSPLGATIYLIGVAALGLHLSHALQSALQSLGLRHPRWTPLLRTLALVLAVVLTIGFAIFPLVLLWKGGTPA